MNVQLAFKVDSCTLARCLESHRFDTCPVIFNGACFSFADQFLKVAKEYGVPVLLHSSSDLACCVKIQMDKFSAEQSVKIKKSLDKLVIKSALAETERGVFPLAFSRVGMALEEKHKKQSDEDKAEFKARYGGMDWSCEHRDSLGTWMNVTKNDTAEKAMRNPCIDLWISSRNRLGLIAHLINLEPGLSAFCSKNGKRMELPLMVFELLSVVNPVVYRKMEDSKDPTDFVTGSCFQTREYANGGFLAGLPYRSTSNHPCLSEYEGKSPMSKDHCVLRPVGGMTALFALFSRSAKLHNVDISHFDGFIHSAMGYAMGIVNYIMEKGDPRKSVLPLLGGSEAKIGWRLVRQANKAADEDVQNVVPLALDAFRGLKHDIPVSVIEATKRGFCRQFITQEDKPSSQGSWKDTRYTLMTMADAEKCLSNHAHYDAVLKLREWSHNNKSEAEKCKEEHKTELQTLAQENKTSLASLLLKKGPKTPSRVLCIELKNVNAANCVPCIQRVLMYGSEFFAVEYFSREDGYYNTLIVTRVSEWNAYQTYCATQVFSPDVTLQNFDEGLDVTRMPQAASIFQLITSGSPAQLRVAFWVMAKWFRFKCSEYPISFPMPPMLGGHARIVACLKKMKNHSSRLVEALICGLCDKKFNPDYVTLVRAIEDDFQHADPISLAGAILPYRGDVVAVEEDPTRYESMLIQKKLGRPRSKAHTFNTLYEPGCSHDNEGVGSFLMKVLLRAESEFCGGTMMQWVLHKQTTVEGTELCGSPSHVCTSLYDFPLAIQRGKGKSSILYVDSSVFIHRREYDQESDKSDAYRWFEMLFAHAMPQEIFEGGNAIRLLQTSALKPNPKKRPTIETRVTTSPQKKAKAVHYDPEVPYSPNSPQI